MAEATGAIQKIKGTIDGVTYYSIMGSDKVSCFVFRVPEAYNRFFQRFDALKV